MKRIIDAAAVLLLFAAPVAVFLFITKSGDFYEPMLLGALLGVSAVIVLSGGAMCFRGRFPIRGNNTNIFLFLFVAAAFVTSFFAENAALSLRATGHLAFFVLAYCFLYMSLIEAGDSARPLWVVAVAGLFFSVHGFMQFLGYDLLPAKYFLPHPMFMAYQPLSIFGNQNLLADFLVIAWPVMAGLWLTARRTAPRLFYLTACGTAFCCILVTTSRSALIALAVGGILLLIGLLPRNSKGKKAFILAGGLALALAICGFFFLGKVQEKRDSTRLREMTASVAIMMFRDHPLTGVGWDRFRHEHLRYQAKYFENEKHRKYAYLVNLEKQRHAHNEFLQIPAETGIFGLLAFLGVLGTLAAGLWRRIAAAEGRDILSSSLLGALGAFCVTAFFSFPLRIPETAALLILVAACAAARIRERQPSGALSPPAQPQPLFSVTRVRIEALLILICLCFLADTKLAIEPFSSQVLVRKGFQAMLAGKYIDANELCLNAFRADTENGLALDCLGIAAMQLDHPEDAVFYFRRALESMDDPMIRFRTYRAAAAVGEDAPAEKELLLMQRMVPGFSLAPAELYRFYRARGRGKEAGIQLRKAIAIHEEENRRLGENADRSIVTAQMYMLLDEPSQARRTLESALHAFPHDQRIRDRLNAIPPSDKNHKP